MIILKRKPARNSLISHIPRKVSINNVIAVQYRDATGEERGTTRTTLSEEQQGGSWAVSRFAEPRGGCRGFTVKRSSLWSSSTGLEVELLPTVQWPILTVWLVAGTTTVRGRFLATDLIQLSSYLRPSMPTAKAQITLKRLDLEMK